MTEKIDSVNETIENRQAILMTIVGIIAIFMSICLMEIWSSHEEIKYLKQELDAYHNQYQSKTGWTSFWGETNTDGVNYSLYSFDAGKTWYSGHYTDEDEMVIDGPADVVYPGLMKTLQDWDNILAYAVKNGPFNPNNPTYLKVLETNGFAVIRKPN